MYMQNVNVSLVCTLLLVPVASFLLIICISSFDYADHFLSVRAFKPSPIPELDSKTVVNNASDIETQSPFHQMMSQLQEIDRNYNVKQWGAWNWRWRI